MQGCNFSLLKFKFTQNLMEDLIRQKRKYGYKNREPK